MHKTLIPEKEANTEAYIGYSRWINHIKVRFAIFKGTQHDTKRSNDANLEKQKSLHLC